MKTISNQRFLFHLLANLLSSLVFLTLMSGCAGPLAPAPTETPIPTHTVTATSAPTATATCTATPTPEPTATVTVTPTPDMTGTAVAEATETIDAFLKEFERDLDRYELTLDSGYLAYYREEPIVIKMKSYQEEHPEPLEGAPLVGDFLMQSEITWDSTSGLAGCGLIFRSGEDFTKDEQYQFYMMRLQNAPGWAILYFKDGKPQYPITLDGRFQFTNIILDGRKSSNKIAILAKGDQFTVYINKQAMRPLTNNKIEEGLAGILGWQESGSSSCTFKNTWIWSFDEP